MSSIEFKFKDGNRSQHPLGCSSQSLRWFDSCRAVGARGQPGGILLIARKLFAAGASNVQGFADSKIRDCQGKLTYWMAGVSPKRDDAAGGVIQAHGGTIEGLADPTLGVFVNAEEVLILYDAAILFEGGAALSSQIQCFSKFQARDGQRYR